jgi:hypothetical protein
VSPPRHITALTVSVRSATTATFVGEVLNYPMERDPVHGPRNKGVPSWPSRVSTGIYKYVPHHRTKARVESDVADPVKVADQLPQGNLAARFNAWFAVQVTTGVGTMWCAYVFALIALVSLPSAIRSGDPVVLVSWVSQTFLQLVLLSVIIVGQNVLAASADKRSEATYKDADAVLHEAIKIQEHLAAQDKVLEDLIDKVRAQRG